MDSIEAIAALAALAQSTRMDTFRLLVSREPEGVPAGELAKPDLGHPALSALLASWTTYAPAEPAYAPASRLADNPILDREHLGPGP